jgi:hypothetical protein
VSFWCGVTWPNHSAMGKVHDTPLQQSRMYLSYCNLHAADRRCFTRKCNMDFGCTSHATTFLCATRLNDSTERSLPISKAEVAGYSSKARFL